jgi:hypothetical protein
MFVYGGWGLRRPTPHNNNNLLVHPLIDILLLF